MGSRANVAVRQNGEWTHGGSNGMGYSLDAWLALGPDPALAVMRSFPAWKRDEWQAESSCEAGALIDLDADDLLVFLNVDYDRRLAAMAGYRRTWPGWTIRWAFDGIADVTGALGLDRAVVEPEPWDHTDLFRWGRAGAAEPFEPRYLVTVGDTAYGLDVWAVQPWQIGPDLLDQLTGLPQPSAWGQVPRGGLHLDPTARRAGVWSIEPVLGLRERFADRWPGWTLEFWEDRYQEQERRCAGAFRFPDPAPAVERCGDDLAWRAMEHWLPATVECGDSRPKQYGNRDPLYGMGDAGLTIAELQRLGELLLGPGHRSRPLDVAAYARRHYGD
ncbi:hypothetical protein ACIBSW_24405 [Actinoplanes sp. NPDC049668]|uniref:hypothetical protein n=1 Tax=unclassified Actinoplanes TaxID=2626549 RepID=UPI0033A2BA3E